jgi:single-strand DNA-binding protein
MNRVILMGRLARDPETQTTTTGKLKCRMTIAVDRPKAKDGTQNADFIGLVAWERTAEFSEKYLSKGQRILVEGRIQTSSYEKDGEKRYATDVNVDRIEFADGKKKEQEEEIPMDDYCPTDIPM